MILTRKVIKVLKLLFLLWILELLIELDSCPNPKLYSSDKTQTPGLLSELG